MKADRPSATAQVVAAALLCLEHDPTRADLLPSDPGRWREIVLGGSRMSRALRASTRNVLTRRGWHALANAVLPDVMVHYASRKARIEAHVRALIAAGTTRVCVLGAGLDTFALRLAPDYPDVEWVELDHPATQALKLRALSGRPTSATVSFEAIDLADPDLALAPSDRPTVFVAEGLLMYFDAAAVDRLLAVTRTAAPAGASWVVTYMDAGIDGGRFAPSSRLIDGWLSRRGEPFTWALRADTVDDWAAARGIEVLAHERSPFAVAETVTPGVLRGENILVLRAAH